jgi:hypothetical protein
VRSIPEILPIEGLPERALLVLVPSVLGALIYFLLASLLKLEEFTWFMRALGRRIR